MAIGNEIANLTIECDRVDAQKIALQNVQEETDTKQQAQRSELSQVIFAIDNIESLCSKKTEYHETHLPYSKTSVKHESFEYSAQSEQTSMDQLDHIGLYMRDFKAILGNFDPTKIKRGANPQTV